MIKSRLDAFQVRAMGVSQCTVKLGITSKTLFVQRNIFMYLGKGKRGKFDDKYFFVSE